MTLLGFGLRNAVVTWWRSLTLGAFLFSIAFIAVVFNSFGAAVKERVDSVIVRGLTGHIQVRSEKSVEQDMVEQYNTGWDDIAAIPRRSMDIVSRVAGERLPEAEITARVRRGVSLYKGVKREQSLLVGLEPSFTAYTDAFLLSGGRYIAEGGGPEILLTQEQASNLKAGIGDTVEVVTRNALGMTAELDFTVVGLGDFIMLSLLSYKACFVDIASARALIGLDAGDATDLLVYLPDAKSAAEKSSDLMLALNTAGLPAIRADEPVSSDELSSEEGLLESQKKRPERLKISTWRDMGKTFRGMGDAISLMLAFLIAFLMIIVGILIVNIVNLMGIERYREIGTLRAIGYHRLTVIALFMGEIMAVATLFSLAGCLLASALVAALSGVGIPSPIDALTFVMGKVLYPRLSPAGVAAIFSAILAFAFAASLAPALRACSLRPAETLRQE